MDIIFISGVQLGRYALKGIIDSEAFRSGEAIVKAIFGLAEEKASRTSGYRTFDDLAYSAGAPLHRVASIKTEAMIEQIRDYAPDLICIIGWSELAPSVLLDIPKEKHGSKQRHDVTHGCIGMHPTLLPQGRGRAPIPWAIIKGLKKSGVTMFYLEEEADAGDIIAQREFQIDIEDDASTVYVKVASLHYELMRDNLPLLVRGIAPRVPQDPSKVTIWKKRTPKGGVIDWNKSQMDQYNWIRALTHPYPGAFTFWRDRKVTIWKASLDQRAVSVGPGTIVDVMDAGVVVACTDGALILKRLQLEDEPELDGKTFADCYGLPVGESFSTTPRG